MKQLTVQESVAYKSLGFKTFKDALHAWGLGKLARLKSSRRTSTGRLGEDIYERMDIQNRLYGLRTGFNAGLPDFIYELTNDAKEILN